MNSLSQIKNLNTGLFYGDLLSGSDGRLDNVFDNIKNELQQEKIMAYFNIYLNQSDDISYSTNPLCTQDRKNVKESYGDSNADHMLFNLSEDIYKFIDRRLKSEDFTKIYGNDIKYKYMGHSIRIMVNHTQTFFGKKEIKVVKNIRESIDIYLSIEVTEEESISYL